jgi:hypothetical protein
MLLATFPQLFELYIEGFISLLEFFPENNLITSKTNQVCVCVQTNILNAEFK